MRQDPEYPQTEEERDDAVQRAEIRIGEDKYSGIKNNCEKFVTEVLKPGRGGSHQVSETVAGCGVGYGTCVGIDGVLSCIVAAVCNRHSS